MLRGLRDQDMVVGKKNAGLDAHTFAQL
jgi:hypothetical protein